MSAHFFDLELWPSLIQGYGVWPTNDYVSRRPRFWSVSISMLCVMRSKCRFLEMSDMYIFGIKIFNKTRRFTCKLMELRFPDNAYFSLVHSAKSTQKCLAANHAKKTRCYVLSRCFTTESVRTHIPVSPFWVLSELALADLRREPGTRLPPSPIQFLSFSWSFRENFGQIIGWRPLLGGWYPPSGKSWIRHWLVTFVRCLWWQRRLPVI